MTNEQKLSHLQRLYDLIPEVKGCEGCSGNNCCRVPFAVSKFERDRLPGHNFDEAGPCAFLVDGRCSQYGNRPLICRLYGTCKISCSKMFEDGGMKMSTDDVHRILSDYVVLFWDLDTLQATTLTIKEIYG